MDHPSIRRSALTLALAAALLTSCAEGPDDAAATGSPSTSASPSASSPAPAPSSSTDTTGAPTPSTPIPGATTVQIQFTAGDVVLTATLADNPTANAFAAQLPLTVPISDHADTEKVFHPPSELTLDGAPDGYTPSAGDIAYYSPWGNVAVYYRDFAYSAGLVPIARLTGDPAVLADLPDDTELRISLL